MTNKSMASVIIGVFVMIIGIVIAMPSEQVNIIISGTIITWLGLAIVIIGNKIG